MIQIMHLFYCIHIRKNVTETLLKILDGRCDKEKLAKICRDIRDSHHVIKNIVESNRNGDYINASALPWLLMEQKSNEIKEVIQKIEFPTRYVGNITNLIAKKSKLGIVIKTHD